MDMWKFWTVLNKVDVLFVDRKGLKHVLKNIHWSIYHSVSKCFFFIGDCKIWYEEQFFIGIVKYCMRNNYRSDLLF